MKSEWSVKTLGEICDFENGDRSSNYPSRSARTPSGVPFINAGHLTEGGLDLESMDYISQERFNLLSNGKIKPNDILFCLRGSLGKFASVGSLSEGAIASSLVIVRPSAEILAKLLLLYFQSDLCAEMIRKYENGAAQPNLSAKSLAQFQIPLPLSNEQKRIVGVLDKAFESIALAKANAEKNLQNARNLFASAFRSIAEDSKQDRWQKTTVAAVAASRKNSIRTGPFGSQLLHSEFVDDGISVLGIDNAVANEFRWGRARFITPQKYAQLQRYTVHPGDVLITIMGTCGRCAIVPEDVPIAINSKHLCCITLDQGKCLPGYLHAYFLYHSASLAYLAKYAKGAIMAGLNMGLIKDMPLLLPSLDRQREIIRKLEEAKAKTQNIETIYQQKLAALEELKKSLLQRAFSGRL